MFAFLVAIVLAIGTLTPVQAPLQAPSVSPVQAIDTQHAAWAMYANVWLSGELTQAGIAIPSDVTIIITDTDNCGSLISPNNTGGGCTVWLSDDTVSVLISPTIVGTKQGSHILFHELGHALYHLDECGAEYFSHNFSNASMWSYETCNV